MQIEKNRLDAAEIVTVSIQPEHPVEKIPRPENWPTKKRQEG